MQAVYLSSYLSMFSTIFLPTTSQSLVPLQSKKRGMVMNYIAGDVAKANCGWYYNYGVKPTVMNRNRVRTNSSVGFVPMVQNRLSSYALTTPPEAILGFNEPDLFSGASMTAAEAISYWPRVTGSGAKRIGSPACTRPYIWKWLPPFLAGNSTYIPRVDFIPLHWYDINATNLILHVQKAWDTFHLPIWITEFSIADWNTRDNKNYTAQDAIAFIQEVLPAFEAMPFVERYSWYSDVYHPAIYFASLWTIDGNLTEVGLAYAGLASNPTVSPTVSPTSSPTAAASNTLPTPVPPSVAFNNPPSTDSSPGLIAAGVLGAIIFIAALFAIYKYTYRPPVGRVYELDVEDEASDDDRASRRRSSQPFQRLPLAIDAVELASQHSEARPQRPVGGRFASTARSSSPVNSPMQSGSFN